MELKQELEWNEAQKISINVDLVAAAKRQLLFLEAVDRRNRWLCDGPALQKAIYRYNACWLPLLAKYSKCQILEGPLVVPLDCEWIWHCHRLNPVRYKSDCLEFYGRILDNLNVVSSVQGNSKRETEEIWNTLYPNEPYELELTSPLSDDISGEVSSTEKYSTYDLILAVKRQVPFFYQVSRPHMDHDVFLEGAVARYKGFLHLIKRNRERSIKRFCVPTYDIDLIWHTHQLHPVSYCNDLVAILGKVLEHDDTDSDRTKGKKLDVGFSVTTKQWEETFGSRYWRAGAMYRGSAPSPLTRTPWTSNMMTKRVLASNDYQKRIHLPEGKVVEVMLEFVGVRNLPEGHKGSLFVLFSKTQPDTIFNVETRLNILPESGEKQVALFQCQPTGQLLFDLVSDSPSNLFISRPSKTMGSTSISLENFLFPVSSLTVEKWLELVPSPGTVTSKPIGLRVAISFTIPTPAPYVLHIAHSWLFSKICCFFPLPGRVHFAKEWTRVIDAAGNDIISLLMRDFKKEKGRNNTNLKKEVIGLTKSDESRIVAEFDGIEWSFIDSQWSLKLERNVNKDGSIFELIGHRIVKLFPGRKLEYELKHCNGQGAECDFITAVEFSAQDPYGNAVALFDLKSETFQIKEEWFVLPGMTVAFILSDILRKEGYKGLSHTLSGMDLERDCLVQEVDRCHEEDTKGNLNSAVAQEVELKAEFAEGITPVPEKGGACGGGCGNTQKSGGCGSGCGGGCGNTQKSGGCGSGCGGSCGGSCGGGCGNRMKSSGCGGGGSGCGGGCGSSCGGGCGNTMKSSGCGGGVGSKVADGKTAGNPNISDHQEGAAIQANEAPTA
ncbi:unnamed protein product [Ilex paraguariensis]|uniref:Glycine-rich domain-containing protein 1 n=1 Tax=Ilex paraguariensis TaxID=185542 RepID=A0ABC8S6G3_9AQUA